MTHVGIVLISHSEKIAIGLKEIIREVIDEVPVELASGMDKGHIGTSVERITSATLRADEGKGVLLFYDLGSAKMNADLAMEIADVKDVSIVEAPLIEGAYVAAVEASVGRSKDEILESIEEAFPVSEIG